MRFSGQSWAMGRGEADLPQETREMRGKIRRLLEREIQLQEELDELREETREKEARDLATSLLKKRDGSKKSAGRADLDLAKKDLINNVRKEYEGKLTELRLKLNDFNEQNKRLTDLRGLLTKQPAAVRVIFIFAIQLSLHFLQGRSLQYW